MHITEIQATTQGSGSHPTDSKRKWKGQRPRVSGVTDQIVYRWLAGTPTRKLAELYETRREVIEGLVLDGVRSRLHRTSHEHMGIAA